MQCPGINHGWKRPKDAHQTTEEATPAVSVHSVFLITCGTLRDNIDFLGPPLTCAVAVGPQKVTCKVHLMAKTRVRGSQGGGADVETVQAKQISPREIGFVGTEPRTTRL